MSPTIVKSHCLEDDLMAKSRRCFSLCILPDTCVPSCLQYSFPFSLCVTLASSSLLASLAASSVSHGSFKWLIPQMRLSTFLILYPLPGRIPINSNACIWLHFYLLIVLQSTFFFWPDHSSKLRYPTTSWTPTLVHLKGNLDTEKPCPSAPSSVLLLSPQACFTPIFYIVSSTIQHTLHHHIRNPEVILNFSLIIFFHKISQKLTISQFLSSSPSFLTLAFISYLK